MREVADIFGRGFVIVTLVASNVRFVSAGEYVPAFVTGCAISICWWLNAGMAGRAKDNRLNAVWYGLGAGCGTLFGMWLGG